MRTDILVIFRQQAEVRGAAALTSRVDKARWVYRQLEAAVAESQPVAIRLVRDRGLQANSLRIVNALAVSGADKWLVSELALLPEVAWIGADPWVAWRGLTVEEAGAPRGQLSWGVEKIRAPEVWALGYTGQGITIGGADTGYDWLHPALKRQYRGWDAASETAEHTYNWFDAVKTYSPLNVDTSGNPGINPCGLDAPAPCDDNSHGTHTMGTMVGEDGGGNSIGVAPGAVWVGCRNMERGWGQPSTYLGCFDWFLAPTDLSGSNPDVSRAPHVINNSWYCAYSEGCTDSLINDLLRVAIVNLRAAGVVVVVSNGNSGPSCGSTTEAPAYFEESFSVGATDSEDAIAAFSSRGPVLVDGSLRMKPNVSAPGQDVRSCIPNGQYARFSGTSMAGPHVAGLVALMLSAQPALAGQVEELEHLIEESAVYFPGAVDCGPALGASRPNHTFGWGRIDAVAAVEKALQWQPPQHTAEAVPGSTLVYPNPTSGHLEFDLGGFAGPVNLDLYTLRGSLLHAATFSGGQAAVHAIEIPPGNAGWLFYRLTGSGKVVTGKLRCVNP
jgi:subtilisin family serine protease